ncbi:MAG: hypothetical protein HC880_09235 [Bacteroidia bacterium]|nr:hypothetical protein [Bacteroidia bacterium]
MAESLDGAGKHSLLMAQEGLLNPEGLDKGHNTFIQKMRSGKVSQCIAFLCINYPG